MLFGQFVFPDAEDAPAGFFQGAGDEKVAGLITGNFFVPEGGVALGLGTVFRTTMPEATVHKDRQPAFGKNEIRTHLEYLKV